jgi:hypothetical protein
MNHRTRRNTTAPIILVPFAAALLVSISGCSRGADVPATTPESGQSPAAAATAPDVSGDSLPLRDGVQSLLNPINSCVEVRSSNDVFTASYTRSRGKAFGVAYLLAPEMLANRKSLTVAITTKPALRPQLCLTDASGNVWTAPGTRDEATGEMRFDLSRLQPDPFQNNGRTLPAHADLKSMRMFTLLDISGFMGGAEVPCEWTIGRIDVVSSPGSSTQAASASDGDGGGR